MRKKIYFRADASATIGYGHFVRTLALADMLKNDFDCTFFTVNPTHYQLEEINRVCKYLPLPSDDSHFNYFLSLLKGDEIVVLDNYFFTTEYQQRIKDKGCCLVCIDDMHDKHYVADIVINHALTNSSLFSVEPYTKLCLGFDWALLREEFFISPPKRNDNQLDIVVCLGGSDPYRITNMIVRRLLVLSGISMIRVIAGDKVCIDVELLEHIEVYRNISARKIVDIMDMSKVAILSASTICIEALARNISIISGYYVDNQVEFYSYLKENNIAVGIGDLREIDSINLEESISKATNLKSSIHIKNVRKRYFELFKEYASCK